MSWGRTLAVVRKRAACSCTHALAPARCWRPCGARGRRPRAALTARTRLGRPLAWRGFRPCGVLPTPAAAWSAAALPSLSSQECQVLSNPLSPPAPPSAGLRPPCSSSAPLSRASRAPGRRAVTWTAPACAAAGAGAGGGEGERVSRGPRSQTCRAGRRGARRGAVLTAAARPHARAQCSPHRTRLGRPPRLACAAQGCHPDPLGARPLGGGHRPCLMQPRRGAGGALRSPAAGWLGGASSSSRSLSAPTLPPSLPTLRPTRPPAPPSAGLRPPCSSSAPLSRASRAPGRRAVTWTAPACAAAGAGAGGGRGERVSRGPRSQTCRAGRRGARRGAVLTAAARPHARAQCSPHRTRLGRPPRLACAAQGCHPDPLGARPLGGGHRPCLMQPRRGAGGALRSPAAGWLGGASSSSRSLSAPTLPPSLPT